MKLTKQGFQLEVEAGVIALTEKEYNELNDKLSNIELEDSNFRVDSTSWKACKEYLENPEGDIWEILEGKYKGEQLFTWDAAMRETQKRGKRIPTKEEFVKLYTNVISNFLKAGYRLDSSGSLADQDSYGYCWSSSTSGTSTSYLYFYGTAVYPASVDTRANGFSVRCVKG